MKRIYHITTKDETFLVNASNRAQALMCVAKDKFGINVATQMQLVEGLKSGLEIKEAGPLADIDQLELNV